jgi:DNA-directed RNA polymerase specialized sigma24 family protein
MNGENDTARSAATLMGRCCDGDGAAFLALYEVMAPALLAHLIERGPDQAEAEAETMLQTTFLELHSRRAAYVRGADPLPWAKAIADHVAARCRDAVRPGWLTRAVRRFSSPRPLPSTASTERTS